MIPTLTKSERNVIFSTGNIIGELGRRPSDELYDGLLKTISSNNKGDDRGQVKQTPSEKLTENGRHEISIAAKIFLNKNSSACIKQAVEAVLEVLGVTHVDNVVLAYHPNATVASATPTTPTPKPPCAEVGLTTSSWSERNGQQAIDELKSLYKDLQQFALNKQISALGIADLDANVLAELYEGSQIQPSIAQINLASCCVVPPELTEFCNQHDIQLLTHADPELLLPEVQFKDLAPGYTPDWILRYQVHLRCRGVLTARGYIIGASVV